MEKKPKKPYQINWSALETIQRQYLDRLIDEDGVRRKVDKLIAREQTKPLSEKSCCLHPPLGS